MTLAIGYDNNFLNEVCGKNKKLATNRAKKIVDLAATYFKGKAGKALGTTITLSVKAVTHVDAVLKLSQGSAIGQAM